MASLNPPPLILAHYCSSPERVEELRREFECVRPLHGDFTEHASVVDMAERIEAEYGIPQGIVYLPAMKLVYERFSKFNWERFSGDVNVQLRAAITVLQKFAPRMAKMPRAKIVFVLSSVTRGMPPKYLSMYTIAKYAQLGLMRSLASEYADTKLNVNAVSPGMVDTRFLDDIPDAARQLAAAAVPQQRLATPDEVVGGIEFLLSAGSDFMTGIEIPITGGSSR